MAGVKTARVLIIMHDIAVCAAVILIGKVQTDRDLLLVATCKG